MFDNIKNNVNDSNGYNTLTSWFLIESDTGRKVARGVFISTLHGTSVLVRGSIYA